MRAQRLESALKALLFAEAWAGGWRPGGQATLGPLALLAVQRARRPDLHAELGEEPTEWVRALLEAPAWLASARTEPQRLGPPPICTTLELLDLVARYRRPEDLGLAPFLEEQLQRLPRRVDPATDPLAVDVGLLSDVCDLTVTRAARALGLLDSLARMNWGARGHPELVLALHAAQAGGFLVGRTLPLLTPLRPQWRPMLVLPLAALFCAAQSPEGAVSESWSDCLPAEAAALIDAAVWAEGKRRQDVPEE